MTWRSLFHALAMMIWSVLLGVNMYGICIKNEFEIKIVFFILCIICCYKLYENAKELIK
jgi:hypothetical protein